MLLFLKRRLWVQSPDQVVLVHWKRESNDISVIVKLAILVESDPKAPFSIVTTPRCRGVQLLLWIAPLYPWSLPYVLSKVASTTMFWVFGMTRPRIELQFPGLLTNTLLIRPMDRKRMNLLQEIYQLLPIAIDTGRRLEGTTAETVCL